MQQKFNFKNFPELTTNELLLRQLNKKDAEMVLQLRSNTVINAFIKRDIPTDTKDALVFINRVTKEFKDKKTIYWGIVDKKTQQLIGSICFWRISEDGLYAEIGYELHPNFHKKGWMSQAMQEVLRFGFQKIKFKTVEAFTHQNNSSSKTLLEKHNFVYLPNRVDIGFEHNDIFQLKNYTMKQQND